MKISLLVPVWNEGKSLRKSIASWLSQTRPFDEIVVVDDNSTDNSAEILAEFSDRIKVVRDVKRLGNKSYAQEYGLQFVTGDVMITTDGDTLLDKDFCKYIEEDMQDPNITAVAGYVRSLKHNWLTACRAFEYAVGQNLHKLAQNGLNFLFVIPGAAGAFRVSEFRKYLTFEHDTVTEDLDFTWRMHRNDLTIKYDRRAIVYTQDPFTLKSYIGQMRRWYGGGYECLLKHKDLVLKRPKIAFEVSLMYLEGLLFSSLLFVIPFMSIRAFLYFLLSYLVVAFAFGAFAAWKDKRWTMLLVPIPYLLLVFINSYIFLEQIVRVVILNKRQGSWFQAERAAL